MTPSTVQRIQQDIGVAYHYVEREFPRSLSCRKTYMHAAVPDQPFDVTVVNVKNLPITSPMIGAHATGRIISRPSSFENIVECSIQDDPFIPFLEDAAYAAKLNNQGGAFPRTAPYRASALSRDPTEFAYSVRARLSSPLLGFNPSECHEGIRLTDTNHCAVRVQERGLYKSVRSVLSIPKSTLPTYFEIFIYRRATGGGVCIGLSTHELPLNCLCGTRPNSIGVSTSGNLIQTVDGKESWRDFGEELHSGSTVGCLVSIKTETSSDSGNTQVSRIASSRFYANGVYRGTANYKFVGGLEVFPTLSLFANHARVYAHFSKDDMLYAKSLASNVDMITLDGKRIEYSEDP